MFALIQSTCLLVSSGGTLNLIVPGVVVLTSTSPASLRPTTTTFLSLKMILLNIGLGFDELGRYDLARFVRILVLIPLMPLASRNADTSSIAVVVPLE